MKMKWGLFLVAVAVLSLVGCSGGQTETPTPEAEMAFTPIVSVTGKVVPAVWATVGAQSGGVVSAVTVAPGDEVSAGEVLVELDSTDAQLAVQQAEAAVAAAQAQLALIQAGPRPEEVAAAEAQVEAARAVVSQTVAQRDQLWSGSQAAEVAAARAQVAEAEAAQRAARAAHDETLKCYDVNGEKICPGLGEMEERARYELQAANEALAAAQAQLDALTRGSYAQVRAADAAVAAAEARARAAQAQLDLLLAGARPEEVAAAEAAVAQAEAALETARVALERCRVRAPFAGTVGAVYVRMGETVAPGQPIVTLGDLTTLRVETTDLDEIDVTQVAVGQRATVTFDGLPERAFAGQIVSISPMAEPGAGGVNYTVIVELETLDPQVRWGMTAFVDIEVGE